MYREKRKSRKHRTIKAILSVILLSSIAFCIYSLKFDLIKYFQSNKSKVDVSQTTTKNGDSNSKEYNYITKNRSDIGLGELVLVNNSVPYRFAGEADITSVYSKKNKSYKVAEKSIALNTKVITNFNRMMNDFEKAKNVNDIVINSGYRTKNEQEKILNEKIKQVGVLEAGKWAAQPGYSEHHTGYAMDISIYNDGGKGQSYTGSGKYSWINEICGNYGFILRYDRDKTNITGIAYEPWHYRYVGVPHANIIRNNGFCLEEYIDYLKNYGFETRHLEVIDFNKTRYEIYYVKAGKDKTNIPVPKNKEYSISGNNVDGFIVTVKK